MVIERLSNSSIEIRLYDSNADFEHTITIDTFDETQRQILEIIFKDSYIQVDP